jgi:hypothetical protein
MHDQATKTDDDKILDIRISGEGTANASEAGPSVHGASDSSASVRSLAVSKHRQVNLAFYVLLIVGIVAEAFKLAPIAMGSVLVYFGLGLTLNPSEKNSEKFADSLYYMGFILTIWALIFSLQPWRETTTGLTSAEILPLFGVALVSTALGMTLRIFLIQGRNTVFDQEEQARDSIDQHVGIMIGEMQRSSTLLRETNDKLSSRGDELIATLRAQLVSANKTTTDELTALVNSCKTEIETQLGEIAPAIEQAKNKLQAIEIPNDLVRAAFNESIATLKTEMARLEKEMSQASTRFTGAIQTGATDLQTSLTSITEISARLSRSKSALVRFTDLVEQVAKGAEKNATAGTLVAEAAEQASKRLNETASASAQAVERVASSAVNLTKVIEGAQQSLASDTAKYGDSLRQGSTGLNDLIQVTGKNVEKFEQSMDKTVTFIKTTLADTKTS